MNPAENSRSEPLNEGGLESPPNPQTGKSALRDRAGNVCLALPAFWLVLFFLVPLLLIMAISLSQRGEYGELQFRFTLENYRRLIGFGAFGYSPMYLQIIARSWALALTTTIGCAVLALPLAFFLARLPARQKNLALTLLVIPFWTNLLIRTYAWQILLSPAGGLYPGWIAVQIGMICDYLPFMALPLYASVERVDWELYAAASDLGAAPARAFVHAVLPQLLPGLGAGVILVLLPATGQFVVPDLLGGAKTALLGNVIEQQFRASRDWPFGCAIATTSVLALFFLFQWYRRQTGRAPLTEDRGRSPAAAPSTLPATHKFNEPARSGSVADAERPRSDMR